MLDVHSRDDRSSPECHDPVKKPQASPSTDRLVSKQTPITPATAQSTVAASPTSSVHSTPSVDIASQDSEPSSAKSSRSTRFTLPSPSRSRIDPEYAARLGPHTLASTSISIGILHYAASQHCERKHERFNFSPNDWHLAGTTGHCKQWKCIFIKHTEWKLQVILLITLLARFIEFCQ